MTHLRKHKQAVCLECSKGRGEWWEMKTDRVPSPDHARQEDQAKNWVFNVGETRVEVGRQE